MKNIDQIHDTLIELGIATEDEITLVTSINGTNEEAYNDILFVGLDRSLTNTGIAIVSQQKLLHKDVFGSKLYGVERLKDLSSQVLSSVCKYQPDFSKVLVMTENYAFGKINQAH